MITKPQPAPDRETWLAQRRQRMGATDVSAILGINPYRTAYEVWLDKTDRLERWSGNDATYLGNILEPALLDEAERLWGKMDRNVVAICSTAPIASTLDGYLLDHNQPVEIKTAGLFNAFKEAEGWGEANSDEVPDAYLCQVQTQMLCSNTESAKLLALIAGRGLVEYEINVDHDVCNMIVERCGDWWDRHIVQGHEPSRDALPSLDVIKRIRRTPGSMEVLDDTAMNIAESWEDAKLAAKECEKEADRLKAELILALESSEGGQLPDGRVVTFMEQERKSYVAKASKFRVLKIKKGRS